MAADISNSKQVLIISSNSFWNIRNFRSGLIDALSGNDWRVVVAAPEVDQDWVRRETVLAMLTEARRDAARGREAGCVAILEQALTQLRRPAN